ncbi:putative helix-loop-helix DNA-binding domain-containing protein [Rosellinia necatrix]|uniref:Putative helix-loop-helix DNA-binding domain-containing protein n=1 Tax=Rosellinia necatrix TaxID=77044 RepID=A0A1W2TUS8_ROSNE|nr:putative helix-loop-helix DNA-binding domain-containing protein [Rosellinia necatrix]
MASSSDMSEDNLPFGYGLYDEILYRPPSPRYDPILNQNDSHLLGSFFTGMESNGYSTQSFGEGLSFTHDWFHGLAPNLLGHSTSFGPQPPLDLTPATMNGTSPSGFENVHIFRHNTMPPPPAPPLSSQMRLPARPLLASPLHQPRPQSQPTPHNFPQQSPQPFHNQRSFHVPMEQNTQTDAASILTAIQCGHSNTYSPHANTPNGFHPQSNIQPVRDHRSPVSQSHLGQLHNDPVRLVQPARSNEADTLFTDMIFGCQEIAQRPAETELQWGSDSLFGRDQRFVPPQHESSEALEKKRIVTTREALKFTSSIPNTRASSPIRSGETPTHTTLENSNGRAQTEENAATPSRKRRKSTIGIDRDEDGDQAVPSTSKAAARKRKSKVDLNGLSGSSQALQEASGKRRKSAPGQSKPPRENLTDAQKRENHIKSEQKRRGAIKEGFDDLSFIVPNLPNSGYSKSTMLNIAGEWLESLIKGNQMLDSKQTPSP